VTESASGKQARVIWSELTDQWRDLTDELKSAGETTVISRDGAARLLAWAPAEGPSWHARVPLEGGKRMPFDQMPQRRLLDFEVTPCGTTVIEGDYWEQGTAVRLVLAGLHPEWLYLMNDEVLETVARVLSHGALELPDGHPDEPCRARYCWQRLRARSTSAD